MPDLNEKIKSLLSVLGDSPDDVAQTLRAAGVRGYIGDSDACPVAHYLKKGLADDGLRVSVYDSVEVISLVDPVWETVLTPEPVFQFIQQFDEERFPELMA